MKRALLCVFLAGCMVPSGGEPPAQRFLRLAGTLGSAALNIHVVPKLKTDYPQIMAVLDADKDGQLSPQELENALLLTNEADLAVLVLLVVDALQRG